jgi:hypothetical protein
MQVGCEYHLAVAFARDSGVMAHPRPMPATVTPPPYSESVSSDRLVRYISGNLGFVYCNSYPYRDPGNVSPSDEDIGEDDLDRVDVELFLEGSEVGYVRMVS